MKRRFYTINTHPYKGDEKKKYMKWILKEIRWNSLPSEIRDRDYFELLSYLLEKEFTYNGLRAWYDANSYENGMYLRSIYVRETGQSLDTSWASVLDVWTYMLLLGRFNDIAGYSPRLHFEYLPSRLKGLWHPEAVIFEMIMNMGLDYFDDDHFDEFQVDYILDVWLNRDFRANGWGTPFPLDHFKGVTYAGFVINDVRDMAFSHLSSLYSSENADRFKKCISKKINFYDEFKFKEQKKGYHFALEQALKTSRVNAYGSNVLFKSW